MLEKQHRTPRDDAMPELMGVIISGAREVHVRLDRAHACVSHSAAIVVRRAVAHGSISGQLGRRLSRLCKAADIVRHMTQYSVDTLILELDVALARSDEVARMGV